MKHPQFFGGKPFIACAVCIALIGLATWITANANGLNSQHGNQGKQGDQGKHLGQAKQGQDRAATTTSG